MRALLDAAPTNVRDCLESQFGTVAGRNSCRGSWTQQVNMQWTPQGTAAFLWLTLMSSCLAYSAFSFLTLNTAPVVVGSYAYVNPCVAALLGWLALGEGLDARQVAGMAVILAAIALASGYAERLVRLLERKTKR